MRPNRDPFFRRNLYGNGYSRTWPSRYWFRRQKCVSNQRGNYVNVNCYNCSRNSDVTKSLPSIWNELRERELFCDAIIESSDHKCYRVHRVIMAAASDYFRALFTNPLAVSSDVIPVKYNSDIAECFVQYCYSGTCPVTFENVEALLPAADELGIIGLIELCSSFLRSKINAANCWGIHIFCRNYFCISVAAEARRYALFRFLDFYREKTEFLEMTADDVFDLLSDDHLNVKNEEHVFKAVDEWITHDLEGRKIFAGKLFKCIRVPYMESSVYFEKVVTVPYIEHVGTSVVDELNKAVAAPPINVQSDPWTGILEVVGPMPAYWPRIPYEIVFAIGGWSAGSPTNCMETYDIRANRWLPVPIAHRDNVSRAYHGLISVDNLVYMIGGFDGTTHFNTVRCFDPVKRSWSEKACMYHARCYVSCVALDGFIYAIGGYNGHARMNSVEKYNIATNQWQEVTPMRVARSDAGATVCNNKIYVAGGFSGQDVLTSAEVFNPKLNKWYRLPDLNKARSGVSLVGYKGFVYAIGGFSGSQRLKSMERYNTLRRMTWDQNLPMMNTKRSNFSCTVIEDAIFVVGGFNGSTTIALTECYNGVRWTNMAPMAVNRSALAVCTVSGLPNAKSYSLGGKVFSLAPLGNILQGE